MTGPWSSPLTPTAAINFATKPPSVLQYRRRTETTRIIIHDSHTSILMDQGVDHLLVQGRAHGLLTIGYNFVIERNGEVVETRPFDRVGSHTPGRNHTSVGVCLVGGKGADDKPEDNFTGQQWVALRDLVRKLLVLYPKAKVLGHSEVNRFNVGKCPACDMEDVRASLRERL